MPFTSELTFAVMNPEFSGAYIAQCDDDISTTKLFDNKTEMYNWIVEQLEVKGYETVKTTILNKDGVVDNKLNSKFALYSIDEDLCYKWGPIEPECGTNIRVQYITKY